MSRSWTMQVYRNLRSWGTRWDRMGARRRLRPVVRALEGRRLLGMFTIKNTDASGTGSLAEAIGEANTNDQANTIVFDPSAFGTPPTITLGDSPIELSDSGGIQTITGPSAGVTISGGGKSLVLKVDGSVAATLSGPTLTGGSTSGSGGGLLNEGMTTLTDCTLSGNSADNAGGLVNYEGVNLTGCTISGNVASQGVAAWSTTARQI